MSESALACPKCGAKISADAPQGLCPKCLLQQASFPTEATGSGLRFRPEPPAVEVLAGAFPQLEIVGLIGRGGMGFVFKARQPKLDRLVALKILAESLSADPSFAERFTREGRALARLSHPNIVTIHDFGQAGPFFYLVMEFIDGVNLRQAMQARQITASEALAIVPKICDALQYAHGEGILHRDIKPDNILLDAKGRVKIADFGIAKLLNETGAQSSLTGSGATLGTVHYMAPEQIERPNEVDHRADIYSLGVVFYEMLTGELPIGRFPAPSEKSAVDPRLDNVVFKTLAKEPARRPQTAGELGTEVQTISSTERAPSKRAITPKVARSYISTPEHLRTWFGRRLIYTGRGELRLEPQQLVWSHRRRSVIMIPLASITGLTLAEFPRGSKPTGLNYISVTWTEGEQPRRILLIPNNGPFRFTWNTNEVVADWFGAIQQAVRSLTGEVPLSAKEQTKPLPGVRIPPYRLGFAKAAAFSFVLLATIFLVSRIFRRPTAMAGFEPVSTAYATNSGVVPSPAFPEGQPAITFDFVQGTPERIIVDSRTEFGPDEQVQPMISYNHGLWAPGGLTTRAGYTVRSDGTNRLFYANFQWTLPKDFATPFAVSAELAQVSASKLKRPLALTEGQVLEVFSISNKEGQTVSGGIEYKREALSESAKGVSSATLENLRADMGANGVVGVRATCFAKTPPGFRLAAFYTVNGEPKEGTVTWNSSQGGMEINWPYGMTDNFSSVLQQVAAAGPIVVRTDSPRELFSVTNLARVGEVDFGSPLPFANLPVRTNVVGGVLELVAIPVNRNAGDR